MSKKETLKGNPIKPRLEHYQTDKKWNHEIALCATGRRIAISTYFGEWNDDHPSGHVDVFQWTGTDWEQIGDSIKGDNIGDHFGYRLAITADGNRVFISGSRENNKDGGVRVYELHDNAWTCIHKFIGQSGERLGRDIAVSDDGRRIAIGNYQNKVKIYEQEPHDSSKWLNIGEIEGDKRGDQFGFTVDLSGDGNLLVVGATGKFRTTSKDNPGKAKAFKYNKGEGWLSVGQDLLGRTPGEFFGSTLCCAGNGKFIAAGTKSANKDSLRSTGEIRWFHLEDSNWKQIGMIIEGHHENVQYGLDAALSNDGKRLAVSSLGNGDIEPKVHIYDLNLKRNNYQHSLDITPPSYSDNHTFGNHISFTADGKTIAVSNAAEHKVYVYNLPPQSAFLENAIEDQAVYAIQGAGVSIDKYLKVDSSEPPKQVFVVPLPDPLDEEGFTTFLFRAHKTESSVKFQSIKYPSHFLATATDRIDNRYPIFRLELLEPKTEDEQRRATFLIQGGYNGQPNSFAFVQIMGGGTSFFITNTGSNLIVLEAGRSFASHPEKREEVSFYLQKHE